MSTRVGSQACEQKWNPRGNLFVEICVKSWKRSNQAKPEPWKTWRYPLNPASGSFLPQANATNSQSSGYQKGESSRHSSKVYHSGRNIPGDRCEEETENRFSRGVALSAASLSHDATVDYGDSGELLSLSQPAPSRTLPPALG